MRGDLDWIVMKCLEKDRARRYETASGLARDIENYLNDEAVEASPPSAAYRLRKIVRKHRKLLTAAATFVLLLTAATVVSVSLGVRATLRIFGMALFPRVFQRCHALVRVQM